MALVDELPDLKALILETKERELQLAAEEAAAQEEAEAAAAEEAARADSFRRHAIPGARRRV